MRRSRTQPKRVGPDVFSPFSGRCFLPKNQMYSQEHIYFCSESMMATCQLQTRAHCRQRVEDLDIPPWGPTSQLRPSLLHRHVKIAAQPRLAHLPLAVRSSASCRRILPSNGRVRCYKSLVWIGCPRRKDNIQGSNRIGFPRTFDAGLHEFHLDVRDWETVVTVVRSRSRVFFRM